MRAVRSKALSRPLSLRSLGAEGCYCSRTNGAGVYVSGELYLYQTKMFYLHVGATPTQLYQPYIPYGGGGGGQFTGGGASDIRLLPGEYGDFKGLLSRIMVAGASGSVDSMQDGGYAGGLTGGTAVGNHGKGGNQTHGGDGYYKGRFGFGGGNPNIYSTAGNGGGGSGYFGGGSSDNPYDYGGGGGSSYISGYTGCISYSKESPDEDHMIFVSNIDKSIHYSGLKFENPIMKAGNETIISPEGKTEKYGHFGNGYIRITLINEIDINSDIYRDIIDVLFGMVGELWMASGFDI